MIRSLRKLAEIGTVRTLDVVRLDVADAERRVERMPTVRNLERLAAVRAELERRELLEANGDAGSA